MVRRVEKSGNLHGVPWRDVVETEQPPWSPMDSEWDSGNLHGGPW